MNRPYVVIASATTIDGRIASKTGYSKLSCPYDLRRLHELRASSDAVMVGANTVINDNPTLTPRLVKADRNPFRVVIDGRLRIPLNARVVTDGKAPTIVATSEDAPVEKVEYLRERGVEVWICGKGGKVDLKEVLRRLYEEKSIRRVLVEGGGRLNWSLINEGLVDEIILTITPYVFGAGTSVFEGEGFGTTAESPTLHLLTAFICECGREIVLRYKVLPRQSNINSSTRV